MKFSELKGEAALDALADLIEPAAEIIQDKEVTALFKQKEIQKAIKVAIKSHKKAVIEILAVLDGEDPATYAPQLFTLPIKLLEVVNTPEVLQLFQSQGQALTSSGSATESTPASEQ